MKVLVVFGTRPEAIKMCPVIKKLKEKSNIICRACLTGQHEEMLNQVMETFDIKSDYNLHVMTERQTLAGVSARIMTGLQEIYEKEKPMWFWFMGILQALILLLSVHFISIFQSDMWKRDCELIDCSLHFRRNLTDRV